MVDQDNNSLSHTKVTTMRENISLYFLEGVKHWIFLYIVKLCLTQSVVKGAPDAMSMLTSSASPLRDASNNLFPRSTSDDFSFSFILSGYVQYVYDRKT